MAKRIKRVKRTSRKRMARGGGIRKMEHGGSHCPPGMMYQNGGCVSMQYGGMTNRTAANTRAGVNAGSRRQTSIRNRNTMRATQGPNTRLTTAGEFINRRTGLPVPAGIPYHMHPDQGPMEGAVHNPNIAGGTQGHDFFDRTGRRSNARGGTRRATGTMGRGMTPRMGRTATTSYRRGGSVGGGRFSGRSQTNRKGNMKK